MPGLLTLHYTLTQVLKSKYPLVALTSPALPQDAIAALEARSIPHQPVPFLQPSNPESSITDERFRDTWTKLAVFALTGYARIVLLDADMLPLKPLDELMDPDTLPLDPLELCENGSVESGSTRVLAAGHACTCNPMKKSHYPSTWVPANCGLTALHADPVAAQTSGGAPGPLGVLNSGLLVLTPSLKLYTQIHEHMEHHGHKYVFPDQDVLAYTFPQRWVPLSYVYNALKPLRLPEVHGAIWRDEEVKNVHYILAPKPWNRDEGDEKTAANEMDWWWIEANKRRKASEAQAGVKDDGF